MSREIKFRVYSTFHDKKELMYLNKFTSKDLKSCDNWKVMQYTGLKDKDGKEIYEGDVVRIWADPKDYNGYKGHNYIGVVEWDEFILGFILSDGHGLKDFEFIEIVGNIYENPELLNKKGEQWKNHIIIIKNF